MSGTAAGVAEVRHVLDGTARWAVECGDALTVLRGWPSASVRCVVTSPPYWGLRDYGTATWEGGEASCRHEQPSGSRQGTTGQRAGRTFTATRPYREKCLQCGATRIDQQLGLEPTPEEYVARLVGVFSEVRRVLKDDGTVWLNVGDTYNAYNGNRGASPSISANIEPAIPRLPGGYGLTSPDMKPKDLIGIPWRLAFALQSAGWYLRSDVIWAKPNPMPESVTDRPTKAHEYLFLLSKSERYYYDAEAIAEPAAEATYARLAQDVENQAGSSRANGGAKTNGPMKAVSKGGGHSFGKQKHDATGTGQQSRTYERPAYLTRNRRSVWTIPTHSYHGAHFAVMPPALVEPCVLAGSEPGDAVCDPFAGSGTVISVAVGLGRRAVGVELNRKYLPLIKRRLAGTTPALPGA